MNWLLLDAGNSALKWAVAEVRMPAVGDAAALAPIGGALDLSSSSLADALCAELQRCVPPVVAAYGCSVADTEVRRAAEEAVRLAFRVPVTWFASQADFAADQVRLHNSYRTPAQLGADRWHAMLAARAAHPGHALIVVNAGTATTVDCVAADGRFVGGVIAPGVRLMFESLARHTAQLPVAAGELVARPDNTDDAITTGVLDSQIGLIERRVRRFAIETGAPVLVLLDGGNAAALRAHLVFDPALATVRQEQNLVLRGVLIRARAQA